MATVKLGSRPKSFARVVKFKDVDGTELTAPVTYKYRTRQEYGAWVDALPPQPTTKDGTSEEGAFSAEKYLEKMSEWNAGKIIRASTPGVWTSSSTKPASSSFAMRCPPAPRPSSPSTRPPASKAAWETESRR
jgi:hypothetical protein